MSTPPEWPVIHNLCPTSIDADLDDILSVITSDLSPSQAKQSVEPQSQAIPNLFDFSSNFLGSDILNILPHTPATPRIHHHQRDESLTHQHNNRQGENQIHHHNFQQDENTIPQYNPQLNRNPSTQESAQKNEFSHPSLHNQYHHQDHQHQHRPLHHQDNHQLNRNPSTQESALKRIHSNLQENEFTDRAENMPKLTKLSNTRQEDKGNITKRQLEALEESFQRSKFLSPKQRIELGIKLDLKEDQIYDWYQNRRQLWRASLDYSPYDDVSPAGYEYDLNPIAKDQSKTPTDMLKLYNEKALTCSFSPTFRNNSLSPMLSSVPSAVPSSSTSSMQHESPDKSESIVILNL